MVTSKTIGERIRTARTSRSLRPERVASEIGRSVDSLARYESGDADPTALQVWKIAKLTGYPFGWFAQEEDVEIPEQLDRALVSSLLVSLDEHHRRYENTLGDLLRLLGDR